MRFQSYFNTAVLLINQYDGSMPLVHFLKQYFGQHKKHGSKDRKLISHLCYSYFRLGHAIKKNSTEERLKISLFLCIESVGDWQILYDDEWIENWHLDLQKRIDFIGSKYTSFSITDVFPWLDELSDGIDKKDFAISHFIQPDLFLRIRPGNEKKALNKLTDQQIPFNQINETCLALPNASKIDTVLDINKEVVVQDFSSQRIGEFLSSFVSCESSVSIWDCCAASGGKSLLAVDILGSVDLTVSDIRASILQNLKQRFESAGIKKYQSFIMDLSKEFKIQNSKFKIILCDAPCSGSGTWSRTPEQLYFFSQERISEYAFLQKKIVSNVIQNLEENGYLLYITCSVFKKENEEVVAMIEKEYSLQLVKSEVLKGYSLKADSMFGALFRKG